MTSRISTLRKIELMVLGVGLLIALIAVGWGSRGAFQANMAWTQGTERLLAFLGTLASLLIVGAIVIVPYALLAFLGRQVASDESALRLRVAGLVVSSAVTLASAYFYADAVYTVSHDRSSTAGLVFVVVPVLLAVVGGAVYGAIVLLNSRARKSIP